jgi:hypothetical protein
MDEAGFLTECLRTHQELLRVGMELNNLLLAVGIAQPAAETSHVS